MADGEGAIWVKNGSGEVCVLLPLNHNQVGGKRSKWAVDSMDYITVGEGAVWVSLFALDMVARIDPKTNQFMRIFPSAPARRELESPLVQSGG